jgi:hypothetical protein
MRVISVMVMVAVVLPAACGNDPGAGGPDAASNAAAHQFCVQETNRYRSLNGRPALAPSMQLESYANTGAMVDFGGSPHQHFSSTGGGGIAFAENECPHWNLSFGGGDEKMLIAACIQAFFSEGPGGGHYENLMGSQYKTLGCGIFKSGSDYTILQDFGQ